ncbi:hypothetical protein ACFLX4_02885 [Chloroflexota bacterium]
MGLAMRYEKGRTYPILTCDTCREPITDWGVAIAACQPPSVNSTVDVKVFHKGFCDPASPLHKQKHANVLQEVEHHLRKKESKLSTTLDHYIPWLLWNHKWGQISSSKHGGKLTIDVPQPMYL